LLALGSIVLGACSDATAPDAQQRPTSAATDSAASHTPTPDSGSAARFGTAPHESIDASAFVGAFEAVGGEFVEFRDDGTYGARFEGRSNDGYWYAFGANAELRSTTRGERHERRFDLVAVDDELVLVPDDRLSKFVIEVRSGFELSREWLHRALPTGAARPDLPPPFDEIARVRAASVDLAEWRGTFCSQTLESFEKLVIDESGRFDYERSGCWWDHERSTGQVWAFGELLFFMCEPPPSPYISDRVLFAPLRLGARRFIVPCDHVSSCVDARNQPNAFWGLVMHDEGDVADARWVTPHAFTAWFAAGEITARVVRVTATGARDRRVDVVTLDAGRADGVHRDGLLQAAVKDEAVLRVVLVREHECDAIWLGSREVSDPNGAREPPIGAVFRPDWH
jgi:hypothetical protein